MKANQEVAFNNRSLDFPERFRGTGYRGKTGIKKGSFTEDSPKNYKMIKGEPPRKLN